MVQNRFTPSHATHSLRVAGFVAVYAFALAIGTAVLIGLFGAHDDRSVTGADGVKLTAAEVVMQQTAERGVQTPQPVLLAFRNLPNDKRGY